MEYFNLFGAINTFFIIVSLYGILSQVRKIWSRKRVIDNRPTELLSINQFAVSYLAYFSFFIYGYSVEPFNHYIVWPRLVATLLIGIILFEIWADRKTQNSKYIFLGAIAFLAAGLGGLFCGRTFVDEGRIVSIGIILAVSCLIAQGYYHQIKLIWVSGSTGVVDIKMSQFIFMMDVSTIAFALTMGISDGWPLMVLAITSGITKLVIMYLFRWTKNSRTAFERRKVYDLLT